MKRRLLILLLVPLLAAAVEVPPFQDVPEGVWYAFYVNEAARLGVVSGYKTPEGELTGHYGPSDPVTVAEILKMSLEAAKVNELECEGTAKHPQAFDHWAYLYVVCAESKETRLFETFPDLNRPALRSEVLAILHDAFGEEVPEATAHFQDARGDEYERDIAYAAARGVVSGDTDTEGKPTGTFRPNDGVNRAEAAKIVFEQLRVAKKEEELVVTYGNEGFQPSPLTIPLGATVTFKNKSTREMWPATDRHPTHRIYPGSDIAKCGTEQAPTIFDACRGIPAGGEWSFTLTHPGTWTYHDHLWPARGGTIVIRE